MKVLDVKIQVLNNIQREATCKAVQENIELNLSYNVVENNQLVCKHADGRSEVLRKAKFKTVKLTLEKRVFKLKK